MENAITIFNILSVIFLLITIGIIVSQLRQKKTNTLIFTLVAFIILFIVTLTNISEHFFKSLNADEYEDYIEILFIPFLIFAIFTSNLHQEHKEKLIERKKLKAIFNQAFSLLGLLDKDGRLIETNETAIKFIECQPDEHIGKFFWETPYWTHSQTEIEKIKKAIEDVKRGKTVRAETTHYDSKGNLHHIDFTLKPVYNDKNELIYMIPEGRDITETIEARNELQAHKDNLENLVKERTREMEVMNEELRAINEELSNKNEILSKNKEDLEIALEKLKSTQMQLVESEKMASLGLLTAGIAHEINNPVNFIYSGVHALKKTLLKVNELIDTYNHLVQNSSNMELITSFNKINNEINVLEANKALQTLIQHIETGVTRIMDIVQSLRYFVRSEVDEKTPVDIHELINNVLTILMNEYKNRITIERNFMLKDLIVCNPGKMTQVFMNILFNAIQAIPEKGTIYITTKSDGNKVQIRIKDNGTGIADEHINHIFEPFFTTKPIGKGTGLGLSITYKIIEQHNGQIFVNTKKGIGTTFEIELPKN